LRTQSNCPRSITHYPSPAIQTTVLPPTLPCHISKSSLRYPVSATPRQSNACPHPIRIKDQQRCLHLSTPSFPTALPSQPATLLITLHKQTKHPHRANHLRPNFRCRVSTYTHSHHPTALSLLLHHHSSCSPTPLHASNRCVRTYRAFVHRIALHRTRITTASEHSRLTTILGLPAFTRRPQRYFLESLRLA
jgi:hypothetical protein